MASLAGLLRCFAGIVPPAQALLRPTPTHWDGSALSDTRRKVMLVLSRKAGEKLVIGQDVTVTVLEIVGNRVRIGINAPESVQILRGELVCWLEVDSPADPLPVPLPKRMVLAAVRGPKEQRYTSPTTAMSCRPRLRIQGRGRLRAARAGRRMARSRCEFSSSKITPMPRRACGCCWFYPGIKSGWRPRGRRV
jgi:carbon storage regulator CsrA